LEQFPNKFTVVKALLYEKNCEYSSSLTSLFIILKKFSREKRFSKKESSKITNLIEKINSIIMIMNQKLSRVSDQNEELIVFVNFLEDYYSFLIKNNFWLKKIAWDTKKQILNIFLRLGLLENVWHCLFMVVPQKIDVTRNSSDNDNQRLEGNFNINKELSIWAVKNLKMKKNCLQGLINNWKGQLFGNKIDHRRKGVIFNRFLDQISFDKSKSELTVLENKAFRIRVFNKCNHGFLMSYAQQFHLMNLEFEKSGIYNLINEKRTEKNEQSQIKRNKLKCPYCKYPYQIFRLINSKMLNTPIKVSNNSESKGIVDDFKTVGMVLISITKKGK
jgi:hypothetical protein